MNQQQTPFLWALGFGVFVHLLALWLKYCGCSAWLVLLALYVLSGMFPTYFPLADTPVSPH